MFRATASERTWSGTTLGAGVAGDLSDAGGEVGALAGLAAVVELEALGWAAAFPA
jgi:hypothetical protein